MLDLVELSLRRMIILAIAGFRFLARATQRGRFCEEANRNTDVG